jgi:hypothetical protein
VLLLATATVSCGNSVGPLPRSTLSQVVPDISAIDLVNAFPKPADLGPGWKFTTDSLGSDDYFVDFSKIGVARHCAYGDPNLPHIPWLSKPQSPESISGSFTAPPGAQDITVEITVDAPAKSADRLALMRRAYADCGTLNFELDGEPYTETYKPLPAPAVHADESLAVDWTGRFTSGEGASLGPTTDEASYARIGGVVVTVYSAQDVSRMMPAVIAKVRRVLRL